MLFTVVIPVFNSTDYILDTLKSVTNASKQLDYEIILVDDCSTDIDKLKEIIASFDKVKLIEKDSKTNAANSRNIGFLNSTSRYVFFLDSDDHFIAGSIDKRIAMHKQDKASIIFGNFIIDRDGVEAKSELPEYNQQDMRDYILVKKGDVRSSVISIDKEYHNNTLFDDNSQKHQDWIFAFRCWDNQEKIQFDKQYSTIVNVGRNTRMSSSLNVDASNYLYENYLNKTKYINSFSKNNWKSMIYSKNYQACEFFMSIYRPQSIIEYRDFIFYKLIANKRLLPFTSMAATVFRDRKSK